MPSSRLICHGSKVQTNTDRLLSSREDYYKVKQHASKSEQKKRSLKKEILGLGLVTRMRKEAKTVGKSRPEIETSLELFIKAMKTQISKDVNGDMEKEID